jgi:aspartyl-tRNA(Asn)/glutamyl-tRNA(Gln) amidotransferase subunit C
VALSQKEVEHIAELAKLQLTDDEKSLYAEQLSAILDYADRLQQLDTDSVPPMTSAVPLDTVLRDDEAQECLPPEKLLSNAPDTEQGMFRVNAVLD